MVEAESPFRTLLVYKKSETKENIALCRTSVTRRRHRGSDLWVIMSCQTVVTFSSSNLRQGIFSANCGEGIERLWYVSPEGPKLEVCRSSPRDCMAQSLYSWLRATLHQLNSQLTHTRSLCGISASCCRPADSSGSCQTSGWFLDCGPVNF